MPDAFYQAELARLKETFAAAIRCDVEALKHAIAGASESSIIGVGSGGSFTIASLWCSLHEAYTGRLSRPSTPLEIICNPTLAASSPVFLISAEGKNPDITEALRRARQHSARTIHVLTNQGVSPLTQAIAGFRDVSTHLFAADQKDGYLATNSLLLDAVVIARAYGELDGSKVPPPQSIEQLRIGGASIDEWMERACAFAEEIASREAVLVTFSPQLNPIAIDLEAKLAEASLAHCQLADLRSFAHGRHLWLATRPQDVAVLAITEPSLNPLWQQMKLLFPSDIATLEMSLAGTTPWDLIAGLIAQMHLVGAIATRLGKDPAKPDVPQFGRDLYYLDLPRFIPPPVEDTDDVERSKYDVLGARWPCPRRKSDMRRAREKFASELCAQTFRGIVFDYDGTLCSSPPESNALPPAIVRHIEGLVSAGVVVGIASGRGGSIQEYLAKQLPGELLQEIQLGLYNGGWISTAAAMPVPLNETSEFLSHATRILTRLKTIGVPIEAIRTTHPFQVSVRFREGLPTDQMWFVIADALRQSGLDTGTMFKSKHSVDILAPGNGKSRLVAHVIQQFKIDPYEIVTIGDQGAWPGNDTALLEHRFSLSVDSPSRRIDRGWKLAPSHTRDVEATLWYLDRIELLPNSKYRFAMD